MRKVQSFVGRIANKKPKAWVSRGLGKCAIIVAKGKPLFPGGAAISSICLDVSRPTPSN